MEYVILVHLLDLLCQEITNIDIYHSLDIKQMIG
jgi:hypothetical protein